MINKLGLAFIIALSVLSFSSVVTAAQESDGGSSLECGPKKQILSGLKKNYDEIPYWIGDSKLGYEMIVTESPKGTWTMLMIDIRKGNDEESKTCIVSSDGNDDAPSQGI